MESLKLHVAWLDLRIQMMLPGLRSPFSNYVFFCSLPILSCLTNSTPSESPKIPSIISGQSFCFPVFVFDFPPKDFPQEFYLIMLIL